ncbi:acetyl-coenzyme A carboxylase carboxyl transferase subunit beta [Planctomycetales bacterium]|nr:acetyl-coenzyme A carboxylase carboxyl transferase subunit beta [Planctomycetales bacterium]
MAIFGLELLKKFHRRHDPIENPPAVKCKGCGEIILVKVLEENLGVCQLCGFHSQISARTRLQITLDKDSFVEHDADLASKDILNFDCGGKTYQEKLFDEMKKTGQLSAIIAGEGRLEGRRVAILATDPFFLAGSMDSVVGEKFARLAEFALAERLPLITVSSSGGGARMHEGMYSLMQMAKTAAALARLREAGLPFVSVVTECTMGGVWASWAALGDIILAEPGALVGFTGPRVIKTTINAELPAGFQRSEFLLAHGQVDQIVPRSVLRERLIALLNLLLGDAAAA